MKHPDNGNFKNECIKYRNKLTSRLKKTKENYFKNQNNSNTNCPKNLWKVVNNYSNHYKNKEKISRVILESGVELTMVKEMSEAFNEFLRK